MWNRVLLPLDGSEVAERILALVRRLLDRRAVLGDEDACAIRLLRVVTEEERRQSAERARDALADARESLRAATARLGPHASAASVEAILGDPAAGIVDHATQWPATLIAMTTHGRTGLERLVRGSVAERVLRSSSAPLLLANPFALWAAGGSEAPPFQRILVALDGSAPSLVVLPRVAALARLFDAEVVLLHSLAPWPADLGTTAAREAEGAAVLDRARALLPKARVRTRLEHGLPVEAILQAADQERADLLALTTHGRSGPSRWALGSVAESVLRHGRTPVLIERTGAP